MTATSDDPLRTAFDEDGYVVVRGAFDPAGVAELLVHCDRFIRDVLPGMPAAEVFYEDKSDTGTLKQIQRMSEHDEWFHALIHAGRLRAIAERLLDGPVVPRNLQYFNKPPSVGRATPPHQDGYYFMLEPCSALTMWLPLEPVDEENGCIRYVRGSNHRGMRPHGRTGTLGFSQGIVDFPTDTDRDEEVLLPANGGDLMVHHALTIHSAGENRSTTRSRRALGFIYHDERARHDEAAHAAYQRRLAEESRARGLL